MSASISRSKFALLSPVLPPTWTGQSLALSRLLRTFDPAAYCLLSGQDLHANPGERATDFLPAPYYHLPAGPYRSAYPHRLGRTLGLAFRELLQRAAAIRAVLRREKCNALIACSADLFDIPAGFLAARRHGIPFLVYLFDDYTRQWLQPFERVFAGCAWRLISRQIARVVVPNEFLAADLQRRFGLHAVVLHNPVEDIADPPVGEPSWAERDEVRLVYTGAVYEAHFDAFRNLLAAAREIERPRIRVHIYTACGVEGLRANGRMGPVVLHPHLPHDQSLKIQRRADILFLPLAFDSPYPEIIRTSAPMKMGEYLASGRPVLVHAPARSFVSWYFRKHNCGVVVDQSDPAELAVALNRLIAQPELRSDLVRNAFARAMADFRVADARTRFLDALNGCLGTRGTNTRAA